MTGRTMSARRLLLAGAVLLLAACGPAEAAPTLPPTPTSQFAGSAAFAPPLPEPPLVLTDYLGHQFDIAQTRGKVVMVTFLYTHCPDVCPLIASKLRAAQIALGGAANNVVLVAVSTDPVGDTPASVTHFLTTRGFSPDGMEYLLGTAAQLKEVYLQWHIASVPTPQHPGLYSHTALIYGISASGKLTTIYSSDFKPSDIVHDVPILARD